MAPTISNPAQVAIKIPSHFNSIFRTETPVHRMTPTGSTFIRNRIIRTNNHTLSAMAIE
jgi:hypothetical protein